jgi:D-amino-acid dehydrogenase
VIGVTTAYQLLKDGHEVAVVEQRESAGEETSAGNAGLIAPGHAFAWASPAAPKILLKSLFQEDQALRFRLRPDPRLWAWSLKFLRQCTTERARINTLRKHALCRFSQELLHQVVAETGVAYDGLDGGLLYLYRDPPRFEQAAVKTRLLAEAGQEIETIDVARAIEIDPALAPAKDKLAGAIYCPTDESGDSRLFTQALAKVCEDLGATFHYRTTIRRFGLDGGRVETVATDKGVFSAEAYVLALGCDSPILARQLGVKLPIYPIKGVFGDYPRGTRQPRAGAPDRWRRRRQSGCLRAHGRAPAHHRHCRIRRLRPEPPAPRFSPHAGRGPGSVPRGLRLRPAVLPRLSQAHDPAGHADIRPWPPE